MSQLLGGGALAANVMHFGRLLRAAGLPIGPGKILLAVEALSVVNLMCRDEVFWALHSVFVERRSQFELFQLAFGKFWVPGASSEHIWDGLDDVADQEKTDKPETPRRLAEAMAEAGLGELKNHTETELDVDASATWSGVEHLRTKDFESMSVAEAAVIRRAMRDFRIPIPELPGRRFRPHTSGRRIDMRATLRNTVRAGGSIDLKRKTRVKRSPPLVVLCDVSGSMESYARMLLHFLHAVTNDRDRVHTFLFGTRLTNVTHHLAHSDPDVALARVGKQVQDWSGGTRIGETLSIFNRSWSRRVLGQGAIVLLITDGLDRDGGAGLRGEMERLQKSTRRLIWLNPLLRYDAFEPKSAGVKAMLPFVDDFRSVHNLDSLTDLVAVLSKTENPQRTAVPGNRRDS